MNDEADQLDTASLVTLRKVNVTNPVVIGALDHEVSAQTLERIARSVPKSTQRARDYVEGGFAEWCDERGRVALPATGATLADYVTYLSIHDKAPSTIEQALGLIRSQHRRAGYRDQPDTTLALDALRAHKQDRAAERRVIKQAPPIDKASLLEMIAAGKPRTLAGARNHVALLFGWMMHARRSELAAVELRDITHRPEGLDVWVPKSKTDQDGAGRLCSLPRKTDPDFDVVRTLENWRDMLTDQGRDGGSLLYGLTRGEKLSPTPLSPHSVNRIVQLAAARARVENADTMTAHGLRAGGLMDALSRGVPPGVAARHGGWDPESPMLGRYARLSNRWKHNAMAGA